MYVQLDIGWLRHPFPVSSFRVNSQEQIDVLQSLGLDEIRCIPAKSDPSVLTFLPPLTNEEGEAPAADGTQPQPARPATIGSSGLHIPTLAARDVPAMASSEVAALKTCDQRFSAATHSYREVVSRLVNDPQDAMRASSSLVAGYIAELLDASQTAIRLLSESVGEQQGAHPINVTVLSLLLGKSHGLNSARLMDLGLAALLHDVGKRDIDPRCTELLPSFTPEQKAAYEDHVGASVAYGQRMGLSPAALTAIAQHHEATDGTGFPLHLVEEDLSIEGQILALTNCYDKLCNPLAHAVALTPHEALSDLFGRRRGGFTRELVELFVRVMGVYPPGSVVQLSDERYGLVASVRSDQPLKPAVLLYNPDVDRAKAEPVELSELRGVVIKRSLRPAQLPREVLDYLSPRQRVCYFFERAVPLMSAVGGEA
ncbi:DUF3391 domain-containing protein [Comamonas sp. CMM03]|nr:DUF3391 domain-containing protein [Comamonas sp. CMM03]